MLYCELKQNTEHGARHDHARPIFECSEFFAYEREAKCQYSASDQPSKHPADGEHEIDLRESIAGRSNLFQHLVNCYESMFTRQHSPRLSAKSLAWFENIEIVFGDIDKVQFGMGTYGSRSLVVGGPALSKASDKVIAKGKKIAAHLLEASEQDIMFEGGTFSVIGTDRKKTLADIALAAYVPQDYPLETLEPGLEEQAYYDPVNFNFPGGAHVAEVEIDPDTGIVQLVNYTAVDDVGTVINPMIVEGQLHGGIVQGIGQALCENCVYDSASGQLLSGSFMDYCMP